MNRAIATELYNDNWAQNFTTMDALYERIRILSENGAYQACVCIDSLTQYHQVAAELKQMGFDVEDYNGGGNGILEISWG